MHSLGKKDIIGNNIRRGWKKEVSYLKRSKKRVLGILATVLFALGLFYFVLPPLNVTFSVSPPPPPDNPASRRPHDLRKTRASHNSLAHRPPWLRPDLMAAPQGALFLAKLPQVEPPKELTGRRYLVLEVGRPSGLW